MLLNKLTDNRCYALFENFGLVVLTEIESAENMY